MKTLSHLQNEAIERLNTEFALRKIIGERTFKDYLPELFEELENNLKTELANIVKESFKNTRVEEIKRDDSLGTSISQDAMEFGYQQALSDKHNKECEFSVN